MNKEFEFVGVPVHGPEEDYFYTSEARGPYSLVSITSLLKEVGTRSITWQDASAFETSDPSHFSKYRKEYLELNGRVPRVFKVKLTIEAEELSEEESQKFWETKQQQNC